MLRISPADKPNLYFISLFRRLNEHKLRSNLKFLPAMFISIFRDFPINNLKLYSFCCCCEKIILQLQFSGISFHLVDPINFYRRLAEHDAFSLGTFYILRERCYYCLIIVCWFSSFFFAGIECSQECEASNQRNVCEIIKPNWLHAVSCFYLFQLKLFSGAQSTIEKFPHFFLGCSIKCFNFSQSFSQQIHLER